MDAMSIITKKPPQRFTVYIANKPTATERAKITNTMNVALANKDVCPICREPHSKAAIAALSCAHTFCFDCITAWEVEAARNIRRYGPWNEEVGCAVCRRTHNRTLYVVPATNDPRLKGYVLADDQDGESIWVPAPSRISQPIFADELSTMERWVEFERRFGDLRDDSADEDVAENANLESGRQNERDDDAPSLEPPSLGAN